MKAGLPCSRLWTIHWEYILLPRLQPISHATGLAGLIFIGNQRHHLWRSSTGILFVLLDVPRKLSLTSPTCHDLIVLNRLWLGDCFCHDQFSLWLGLLSNPIISRRFTRWDQWMFDRSHITWCHRFSRISRDQTVCNVLTKLLGFTASLVFNGSR